MTLSLTHAFVSAVADGGDASLVRPSDWNEEHTFTMATDRLLGRDTALAGAVEELTVGNGLEFTGSGGIGVANNGITFARLLDATQACFIGATAAGDFTERTPAQARDLIGLDTDNDVTFNSCSITYLTLLERSSDPGDPAEGRSVLWMSDGTGAGDDGDIMLKITAGGVTKTTTLVDFSALP